MHDDLQYFSGLWVSLMNRPGAIHIDAAVALLQCCGR